MSGALRRVRIRSASGLGRDALARLLREAVSQGPPRR